MSLEGGSEYTKYVKLVALFAHETDMQGVHFTLDAWTDDERNVVEVTSDIMESGVFTNQETLEKCLASLKAAGVEISYMPWRAEDEGGCAGRLFISAASLNAAINAGLCLRVTKHDDLEIL